VKVVKAIFILMIFTLLIIALLIGWVVLDFKYIGPWRHERNTDRAEKFNQKTWETGLADVYTINVSVTSAGETRSVPLEMACMPKALTRAASIKNGIYSETIVRDFRAKYQYITRPDGSRAIVDTRRISCEELTKNEVVEGFPFRVRFQIGQNSRLGRVARVTCFGPSDGEVSQYNFKLGAPIWALSSRTERVRDILTRDEYGPADLSIAQKIESATGYPNSPNYFPNDRKFHWSNEHSCWLQIQDHKIAGCSSVAQSICTPYP